MEQSISIPSRVQTVLSMRHPDRFNLSIPHPAKPFVADPLPVKARFLCSSENSGKIGHKSRHKTRNRRAEQAVRKLLRGPLRGAPIFPALVYTLTEVAVARLVKRTSA